MRKIIYIIIFTLSFINLYSFDCFKKQKVHDSSIDDSDLFKKDTSAYYVNLEFLYWTAESTSLEYSITQTKDDLTSADLFSRGEYNVAKYDWDPGFRVSLGWFNAPKFWRVLLGYTYQRISGSGSQNKPSEANRFLLGTYPQVISSTLTKARSNLDLDYDLLDLLVARIFNPNEHLRIRFVGGITATRLRQEFNISYENTLNEKNNIFNKWKFLGLGLKLGSELDWFWGNDFYLTASASAASFVGRYHNLYRMKATTDTLDRADAMYKDYRLSFHTDFLFGSSYQRSFDNNRFEIFLGYELNTFFNLNEIIQSTRSTSSDPSSTPIHNSGAFSMHGLTARFTLDF
jgi:hypothetical protein